MSARTVTAGVRVPVVITTDASQVPMGLQRLKGQLSGLTSRLSGAVTGGFGGMLAGFLGVAGALRGLHAIREEADRLHKLSTMFAPGAAAEAGRTAAVQMQSDMTVGQALAPIAIEREQHAQALADRAATPNAIGEQAFWASLGNQLGQIWDGAIGVGSATLSAASGDMDAARERMGTAVLDLRRGTGTEGWGKDMRWLEAAVADGMNAATLGQGGYTASDFAGKFGGGYALEQQGRAVEAEAARARQQQTDHLAAIARNTQGRP